MRTLLLRRALVQRRLLAAVLALVVVATTLLGVCALLLTRTQDRAFAVEVRRSAPADVDVNAFLVDVAVPDAGAAREGASDLVREVLADLRPTVTSAATSRMRDLGGDRLAYLAAGAALRDRAELTSGRWPEGGREATIPDAAASRLGLAVGDRVRLGAEIGIGGVDDPVAVRVVGTFRPLAREGWETDPLAGAGFEPAYSDGTLSAPAYGPLVVDDTTLAATGSTITGLRVVGHPDLERADDASLRAAAGALDHASALLASRVGDRARISRVASDLPRTLDRIHTQQAATRATVLVVLLLGTALSVAALVLAGRLVADVRDDERTLLVALGLGRRQQLALATVEASALALVGAVVAVPVAALLHAGLTHRGALGAAGLAESPVLAPSLVLAVLAGALVLAATLVATSLDTRVATRPSRRRGVARLGGDVLLAAVAAVAWWQLDASTGTADGSVDVTLTVAPVVLLGATTTLAVRVVPAVLGLAARAAGSARGLVVPLAVGRVADRRSGTAMVLIAAAVAAAGFGLALRSTWEASQQDQADLRVGTDLALTLPAPATAADAATVLAAAGDQVLSPVIDRPLALGRYVGDAGARPVLVAVDGRRAGDLLRGRLDDGRDWAGIGAGLVPATAVDPLPLPDGSRIDFVGRGPAGVALEAVPTVVVADAGGFRSPVSAAPLPLDGRPHRVRWLDRIPADARLLAVRYEIDSSPGEDPGAAPTAEVDLALRVPAAERPTATDWQLHALGRDTPIRGAEVEVADAGDAVEVRARVRIDLAYFAYTGADLVATAFAAPDAVPVAVSQELVDAVGGGVGTTLSAIVGDAALELRVTAVVPTVPSAPGQVAVLADADALDRALLDAGRLDPVVDGWWVADPSPATVAALSAADLGEITTRSEVADGLEHGPLRATVPAALSTLVVAAGLLLLAGVALVLGSDGRRRSAEVARLRALGLPRRSARRLLLAEHAALVVPLVVVGALVGGAAAALIGPLLIRSDVGTPPVPPAVLDWPGTAEALLVGGLLLGALLIASALTRRHVRRSDPALLRTGDV